MNHAYDAVFEQKAEKVKKSIRKQLALPKKERDKNLLKTRLKELKRLKSVLKSYKKEHSEVTCPHCNQTFELGEKSKEDTTISQNE